jgi:Rap1a immunity proteins
MRRAKISVMVGSAMAALSLLTAGVFAATVSVEEYRHPSQPEFRNFNKLYLDGVKEGFIAYGMYLLSENRESVFCLPHNLALTVEQAENIVLRWAEKQTMNVNELPVSLALLLALQETFPCKTQ